jgi:8-oxo-dGTP pyrophosphatase MutT (NUDIX family)
MTWKPHVTVAAIIERQGKFLMVEELCGGKTVINQPAGHLEDNENLIQAVIRETLEEAAWHFTPAMITGIYQWTAPRSGKTFLRVCFSGHCDRHEPERELDDGIIRALWLSPDELRDTPLRSPLVLLGIKDYLAGVRYPLELLTSL